MALLNRQSNRGIIIMEEFAKMIYEQWCKGNEDRDVYLKKGEELVDELHEVLSLKLSEKIYETFCDSSLEIEERSFIAWV